MKRISAFQSTVVATSVMVVAALGALASQRDEAKPSAAINACVAWGGARSAIKEPQYVCVTNAENWHEVWRKHIGERVEGVTYAEINPPQIDFDRFMVVAVFEGVVNQTANISVDAIDEFDDHVRIRCMPWVYAVSWGFDKKPTKEDLERLKTTPYGFIVLPHMNKALVLERQEGGKSSPIRWEHVARIDAR